MRIETFNDLVKLEGTIYSSLRKFKLEQVLVSLTNVEDKEPFMIAGTALFATRFCTTGAKRNDVDLIDPRALDYIIHLVTTYLIADPITFDEALRTTFNNENPVFVMLRMFSPQQTLSVTFNGQIAQSYLLFRETMNRMKGKPHVPTFDFEGKFYELTGVGFDDFLDVGFTTYAFARAQKKFARDYYTLTRDRGAKLPGDDVVVKVLKHFAANRKELRELYERRKEKDRRFAMYDFNPLVTYPLVRPWTQSEPIRAEEDRMVAPVPDLITEKLSSGVFYMMFNQYGLDFSRYFGYLFEEYVGHVLEHCVTSGKLFSEEDIRRSYSSGSGKVPDWAVVEGDTAVLFECKATRFTRAAVATGAEEAVNDSLKQVVKGLNQLNDFVRACQRKATGLEAFHNCTHFHPVIITHENLYLINSVFFVEHINPLLDNKGKNLNWQIMPVAELEMLQPHLKAGHTLGSVFQELESKSFHDTLDDLVKVTSLSFKESFLYQAFEGIYKRIIPSSVDKQLAKPG